MKRSLIVGGSVGAVVLLVLVSFNSVVASNVNIQKINEEKRGNQFISNLNLLRNYVQKHISTGMQIDIFIFLYLIFFIVDCFLYLFVWILDNWPT